MSYVREDGRGFSQLRPVTITTGFPKHAEGSALIRAGDTHVICTATIEDRVPPFLKGKGQGWVTAEYGMLPRATSTRTQRDNGRARPNGRNLEIQRLIGRSLRAVVELGGFGERSMTLDCDVIQADGGTRTASITGAFVAMVLAFRKLMERGAINKLPVKDFVAAISVGVHRGAVLLDLKYEEDSAAEVDMNIVRTGDGRFIEVQGTAEGAPFSLETMNSMLAVACQGIDELIAQQRAVLGALS